LRGYSVKARGAVGLALTAGVLTNGHQCAQAFGEDSFKRFGVHGRLRGVSFLISLFFKQVEKLKKLLKR